MDNPKSSFKARASLMDRLVDQHPASHREARPLRTLSRKRLKESLSRDLEWLLNTRTSLPAAVFDEMDLTVIDYGIPDFGSCFTANEEDHKRLAGRVKKAITVFEPRLKNVHVRLQPVSGNEKVLKMVIEADMVVENVRKPVSFLTVVQNGTVEIHEK